jgi:hypothetical protein
MTKARNDTVDYFPHDCKPGKTIKILKSMYGNDGYAFWYQLLQILGSTAGHAYDTKDKFNWLHLLSETSVTAERAESILDTLIDLKAIDEDLWKYDRVIWSGNFVENVADLYRRARHKEPPAKPDSSAISNPRRGTNEIHKPGDVPRREFKVDENPQSKVKESIVKKGLSSDPGPDEEAPKEKEWPHDVKRICTVLAELNLAQDPKNFPKSKNKWFKDMDLLLRVDGRNPIEVEKVIRWGKRDTFWSAVLLSPAGLRKHYSKILIKMNKNGGNHGTHRQHENSRASSEFDGGKKVASDGPV